MLDLGCKRVMAAVGGNEVHIGFSSLATALPFIKAGRVNALAVTSAKRAKAIGASMRIRIEGLNAKAICELLLGVWPPSVRRIG